MGTIKLSLQSTNHSRFSLQHSTNLQLLHITFEQLFKSQPPTPSEDDQRYAKLRCPNGHRIRHDQQEAAFPSVSTMATKSLRSPSVYTRPPTVKKLRTL